MNFFSIFPEIYLTISIMVLLVFGVIYQTRLTHLSLISLLFTLYILLQNEFVTVGPLFHGVLIYDSTAFFVKIIILLSTVAILLISPHFIFEFSILLLISTLALMCLVSAYDLIAVYLSIELMSLSFYILAAFNRNSQFSTEAGLKYFVLGALSSGLLLFGAALMYGYTGLTNFADLIKLQPDSLAFSLGILFFTVSFLFKLAAVPFHQWAPDVYEGAPMPVTAFFAVVPKIGILTVLTRIVPLGQNTILITTALASIVLGSLGALAQWRVKRLLAYSAISHVGFLLLPLIAQNEGVNHTIYFYAIIYILMSVNFFAILLNHSHFGSTPTLGHFQSLSKTNGLLAITLALTLFSMAGIPPLAGFYGKMYVFLTLIDANYITLALLCIVASVVGAVYYIRIIKMMYFDTAPNYPISTPLSAPRALLISTNTLILVLLFLHPQLLLNLCYIFA